MKKIYTILVALAFAGLATAQTYDWNISDANFADLGTFEETMTVDGLTMHAEAGKALAVDANGKELDGVAYTHRLKFGGTGGFDEDGLPLNRVLAFNVDGNVNVTVLAMSSSGSVDRILNVSAGTKDNIIGTIDAPGTPLTATTIQYEGEATTLMLWSPSSGVNIYRIMVGVGVSTNPVLNNASVVSVEYYNISGANMGANLEALPAGIYVEVAKLDNGQVQTKKVVKN